jgi:hypothetical protein
MRKVPTYGESDCVCLPRYVKDFRVLMADCVAKFKAGKSRCFPCVICLDKTDSVERSMFSVGVHDLGRTLKLAATCKRIGTRQHIVSVCFCPTCPDRMRDPEAVANMNSVGLIWRTAFPECRFFQFFVPLDTDLMLVNANYRSALRDVFSEYTTVSSRGVSCANEACGAHEVRDRAFHCCGRCRSVHYCRRKCQRAHWLAGHRQECQEAAPQKQQTSAVANIPEVTGLMWETD